MGERTPAALSTAPASGRMAVGEALTNLAGTCIGASATSSSPPTGCAPAANRARMPPCTTPSAVGMELCPALGNLDPGRQGFALDAHRVEDAQGRAHRQWSHR
jgi:phosphoribosylformylglycinamidine synthase